jgi:NhaA family Na+:H+ antiporter
MVLSRLPLQALGRPVRRFLQTEAAGGVVLIAAVLAALVWANSPGQHAYQDLWSTVVSVSVGGHGIAMDLRGWVNEGLMTVFFLVVGLELKRELTVGELRERRTATVPIAAAAGGMAGSALVYVAVTAGTPSVHGWGIPMATDLALALGVLALLGPRISPSVRLFVLALAVADDLGSIVVIAFFYGQGLRWTALASALGLIALALALRMGRIRWWPLYVAIGIGLWLALRQAGVSPTLAGVAMGLLAPAVPALGREEADGFAQELADVSSLHAARRTVQLARRSAPTAEWLVLGLHPWSSFLAVPVFALANAGIPLGSGVLAQGGVSRVAGGVLLAKLVGKFVGVAGAAWLVCRLGLGRLPAGMGVRELLGVAALAGVGLAVSFLVADLAFPDSLRQDQAKLAVLVAAAISAAVATGVLRPRPLGRGATRAR